MKVKYTGNEVLAEREFLNRKIEPGEVFDLSEFIVSRLVESGGWSYVDRQPAKHVSKKVTIEKEEE